MNRAGLVAARLLQIVPTFLAIGTVVGLLVGYYGGIADAVFGQLVDLVVTFLVLVIAIVAVLGPGLGNMYVAVTVIGWCSTPG